MQFYSQTGEDKFLLEVFPEKMDGFFVDVGAQGGIFNSNTYLFELRGWKGICIEPHETEFEKLKANRPKSICIRCAIGAEIKDKVTFYYTPSSGTSTVRQDLTKFWSEYFKDQHKGYKECVVSMTTLNKILTDNNIDKIDFISIDVEGTELDVLNGFDIDKYQPKVCVIESVPAMQGHQQGIQAYMEKHEYKLNRRLGANLIYLKLN